MAPRLEPEPVKGFVAVLSGGHQAAAAAVDRLAAAWGAIDLRSDRFPFVHTSYYGAEMGPSLDRQLVGLDALIDPARLVQLKHVTAQIEQDLAVERRRTVNLDPGYLDYTKVVLASYKFGGQKVYLREGVYADIVLLYAKGRFEPFAWTFPDFQEATYHAALGALRRRYRQQRRAQAALSDRRPD